jgi:hypothetical protein
MRADLAAIKSSCSLRTQLKAASLLTHSAAGVSMLVPGLGWCLGFGSNFAFLGKTVARPSFLCPTPPLPHPSPPGG